MNECKVISYDRIEEKYGEDADYHDMSKLDRLVYNNCPAGNENEALFMKEVRDAVMEVTGELREQNQLLIDAIKELTVAWCMPGMRSLHQLRTDMDSAVKKASALL